MAGRTGQFEKIVGLPSQESFGFGGKLQHVENRTELETKAVNTKPYVEDKEEEVTMKRRGRGTVIIIFLSFFFIHVGFFVFVYPSRGTQNVGFHCQR